MKTGIDILISNYAPLDPLKRQLWVDKTADNICVKWHEKYLSGQSEHKADLGVATIDQLLTEMEQEALDQLSYIREMRRRLIP